jgi:hypothetical protein
MARVLFFCILALLVTGCTSVSARGLIRDANGKPIEKAAVTVRETASSTALARASSGADGCFTLLKGVRRDQVQFALEVAAPGQKSATFTFERKQRDALLVTLVEQSAARESSIRAATAFERVSLYEPPCAPFLPPDVSSIGIR